MVIVKCKECSKEYEIRFTENYKNFQCECGGDLRTLSFKEIQELNKRKNNVINSSKSTNKQINYEHDYIQCRIVEYSTGTFGGENPHSKSGIVYLKDDYLVLNKNKGIISGSKEININYKDITNITFKEGGLLSPASLKIHTPSKKYSLEENKGELLKPFYNKLKENVDETSFI